MSRTFFPRDDSAQFPDYFQLRPGTGSAPVASWLITVLLWNHHPLQSQNLHIVSNMQEESLQELNYSTHPVGQQIGSRIIATIYCWMTFPGIPKREPITIHWRLQAWRYFKVKTLVKCELKATPLGTSESAWSNYVQVIKTTQHKTLQKQSINEHRPRMFLKSCIEVLENSNTVISANRLLQPSDF